MRLCILLAAAAACRSDCLETENLALQTVLDAVDEPETCVVTEQCTTVALAGSCFDGCSVVAHRDDAVRYRTAMAQVEDEICPAHAEEQCELVPPPCVPPNPPLCLNGRCGQGFPVD